MDFSDDVSHARFLSPGWPSDYRFPSKLWPEAWTMNQPHLDPRDKGIPQVRFGPEILGTVGSTRALSGSERPYNMTVAWHHLLVGLTFILVKQLNHVETTNQLLYPWIEHDSMICFLHSRYRMPVFSLVDFTNQHFVLVNYNISRTW
jgi:hypothetical protein